MKVAINSQPLTSGHKSRGIGFYTKNLLVALEKIPGLEVQEFSDLSEVKFTDLIHYPFFDLFIRSLPISNKFPTVVTIHDVTPLLFSKHYPPGIKGTINNFWQRIALKNVQAVITDSNSSKKDIAKYLAVPVDKIFTVYLAIENIYKPIKDSQQLLSCKTKYQLPNHFALYIGSVNWNKNILNLTQAALDADLDLVIIGGEFNNFDNLDHPERASYAEFLKKYARNHRVHILGFVSDEEKLMVLNLANVLLYPSYYEGFGLPILEAQACGTLVITSNISSMPEVAGEGAILVDPQNHHSITKALVDIINNKTIKEKLVQKGFENVKRFSWSKTAQATVNVYYQALRNT